MFVGIDISAKTLDLCIKRGSDVESIVIDNQLHPIKKYFSKFKDADLVVAMENTGEYNNYLYQIFELYPQFSVYVLAPIHIKKSMGLVRGKNDKIDAIRIARFIEKNYAELTEWVPDTPEIKGLKSLFTERKYLVNNTKSIKQKLKSLKNHNSSKHSKKLISMYKRQLEIIKKDIKEIESLMEWEINQNESLKTKQELAKSVPGVGKVLCWQLICKTNGFTMLTDPRKLACCVGVVPFSYSSGTSIKGKARVSRIADVRLKSTLQMAAMRAVRMDNDLKHYYDRKVKEGKNKMSVLNAVRNKIIHIVLAVVKNQNPYQNRLVLS